jgi:sugar phosphate isomerase/epimerase
VLSIQAWYGYDLPLEERFRLVKQAGFDAVAMRWSNDPGCDADVQQAKLAKQLGLAIDYVHLSYKIPGNLMEESDAGESDANFYLRCVESCAANGIPVIVAHPSDKALSDAGLERYRRIVSLAERLGVTVAIENLRSTAEMEHIAAVLGQIDSPCLGFCFDSGHYNAARSPLPDHVPERFAGRLMAVHLHDNHGLGNAIANDERNGNLDEHLLPFDGHIDWPQTMRNIATVGYQGYVSLEIQSVRYPGVAPEEFLAMARERAMELEKLLL